MATFEKVVVKDVDERSIDGMSALGMLGHRFNGALEIYESKKTSDSDKEAAYARMCSYYAAIPNLIKTYGLFGATEETQVLVKIFTDLGVVEKARVITFADKLLRGEEDGK